ncbi:uncharacterized mitochondrial protein AtMg00810-like [Capsicum annuum]|uniref:uncharacterized mitochondrial protein AtMg00810-like n=1 Tax=Capsicum annuum TaxID=4072 RepID=UPI0007BFE9F2|nr:uncharacterized mitochondrial protein AtMg00810-like [Capsicum annuum]
MKDLGELKFFLDIEFSRSEKGMHLCQRKYAFELISKVGLTGSKPSDTPLEFNHKLTSVEYDNFVKTDQTSDDTLLQDKGCNHRIVGRLLYLTMARPDLAFVVQLLSQHMHDPKMSHLKKTTRMIKYIKGTVGLGLFMPVDDKKELTTFCDFDWASCVETRKSVSFYVVELGDALISWKFKKQQTVSRSSAEAEFRSMTSTVAEITWLTGFT